MTREEKLKIIEGCRRAVVSSVDSVASIHSEMPDDYDAQILKITTIAANFATIMTAFIADLD